MNLHTIIVKYLKKYYGIDLKKRIKKCQSIESIRNVLEENDFTVEYFTLDNPVINNPNLWPKLPNRFITSLLNNEGEEKECIASVLEHRIKVELYSKTRYYEQQEFLKLWTRKILLLKTERDEKKRLQILNTEKLYVAIIILMLIGILLYSRDFFLYPINVIQIAILYSILRTGSGLNNRINICSSNNSCGKYNSFYVSSKYKITVAELGSIFFVGFLFFNSIFTLSQYNINILYSINLLIYTLIFPIIIASIAYQFNQKAFCTKCLIISSTYILQLIYLLYIADYKSLYLSHVMIYYFLFSFLLAAFITIIQKQHLTTSSELNLLKLENINILRSTEFKPSGYLNNSQTLSFLPLIFKELLVLKSLTPKLEILYVTNIECNFCKQMSTWLKSVIEKNQKDVSLFLVFKLNGNENPMSILIMKRLMEIISNNPTEGYNAYFDLLVLKSKRGWLKKYHLPNQEKNIEYITHISHFLNEHSITSTPTIFINNKKLKPIYSRTVFKKIFENYLKST